MGKLSQIDTSVYYPVVIPSTGKKTKYRPFRVREERALLIAQESEDTQTMLNTIESIVKSCVVNCPASLTTFDAEYLFLILRSKSVGEQAEMVIKCKHCEADNPTVIDITKVEVKNIKKDMKLKLSDGLTLLMKYPTLDEVAEVSQDETEKDIKAIASSIQTIYHGDEVYHTNESDIADITEFILNRTDDEMKLIVEFVENIPTVSLTHEFTCKKCGEKNELTVTSLQNFF